MRERGDMHCFHEPFMYDYYVHRNVRSMPYFELKEDHPVAYADIRQMLIDSAANQPVFFKDMAYYVVPQIFSDSEFLERLMHVFLVRDLKAAIVSYFKLDSEVSCEEIGVEAQCKLFDKLREGGLPTLILRAESIRKNADKTLAPFHTHVGLKPVMQRQQWQHTVVDDWQQVKGWHANVIASSSLKPLDRNSEVEEQNQSQQAFELACNEAPHLNNYYDHHLPYYEQLLKHAV